MSKPIIEVRNLSKRYRLGAIGATSLREEVSRSWDRLRGVPHPDKQDFWALRDVSFDVQPGEVVGVIGRNGAGKSTLLKVLSRITEPTSGTAVLRGRVASLLEVGTGFHPELSGRENVYLNGAILGMTHAEVRRKFDEIIAFAEVEQFIDTPVKRYSSGMYVRLAFAVAAHLEPEVLIVDEVLAVGDAQFQTKCLGKMQDVSKNEGRTVFFVSHNMASMARLCSRAIVLNQGGIALDGTCQAALHFYLSTGKCFGAERQWPESTAPGNEYARLLAVRVRDQTGALVSTIEITKVVILEMEFIVLKPGRVLIPNIHIYNEEGVCVFVTSDADLVNRRTPRAPGIYRSQVEIPGNFLSEGGHYVSAALSTVTPVIVHFFERDVVVFHVQDDASGESVRGDYVGPYPGAVRPKLMWETQLCAEARTRR